MNWIDFPGGVPVLMLGLLFCLCLGSAALVYLGLQRRFLTLQQHQAGTHKQLQKTQRALLKLQTRLQDLQQQSQRMGLQLQDTAARQQELESRDSGSMSYAHASRLMEMGAASDDLISSCGLSPAEARLFELMHRRSVSTPEIVTTRTES